MSSLDDAYRFYSEHIFDQEKIALLTKHNLKISGSVPSVMWELFGAILTQRSGTGNTGADLLGWEVKSARNNGSYEYQYHLNTGGEKLREDCTVSHLFCQYSETYKDVMVMAMRGEDLADAYFRKWEPEYLQNYDASVPTQSRRQRFRRSIPRGHVASNGICLLRIENGEMVFKDTDALDALNQELE
ncbi:Uncharacterised protein [Halioglobus japonicus]|nr:Uncharacterised protein [Halioglobus japonicus]